MSELLRTTDPVLISFVVSLLNDEGIPHAVFDGNMSIMEGSIGILPRRIMVDSDALGRARFLLASAGVEVPANG